MDDKIFSVSEITKYIKNTLDRDPLLHDVWIKGELSNVREYRAGNQTYFTLKDNAAQIGGVIFAQNRPQFQLNDDMEVLVRGRISVYEKRGVYTLTVFFIEPAGIGALALAFEQLKKKLKAEGLFSDEYKQPIPLYPKRVAVVSSPTGAALHDVISTIQSRNPSIQIIIIPAVVQGKGAASSIVHSIELANNYQEIDVIILARGGGSIEELWGFNEEAVARAIFKSRIPIISAVGHEVDYTISDFVSDKRAATPTAAGVLVSLPRDEYLQYLMSIQDKLKHLLLNKVQELQMFLADTNFTLTSNMKQIFHKKQQLLTVLQTKIQALNPQRLIKKGYILVRKNGKLVKSVQQLASGDVVSLLFHDGSRDSQII